MRPDPVPPTARTAERLLALSYAPQSSRRGLEALLALDDTLAALVRGARTPVLTQLRLAWWRDAVAALDASPPPAHPVLRALAAETAPRTGGARLATLVSGWEALLDEPADLAIHAEARGAGLFDAAAALVGESHGQLAAAGRGWALADVAARLPEPAAASACEEARAVLASAFDAPWPRGLRALGALTLLARADLRGVPPGAPSRVGRLAWHRLTGR